MLESIKGFDKWLDPIEPKIFHRYECDLFEDQDRELFGVKCTCEEER